jgi:hypothetical protein
MGSKVHPVSNMATIPTVDHEQSDLWGEVVDLYRNLLSEKGHKLLSLAITVKVGQNPTSPIMIRALKRSIKSYKDNTYPY